MTIKDELVRRALARDQPIEITTIGCLTEGDKAVIRRSTNSRKWDHA